MKHIKAEQLRAMEALQENAEGSRLLLEGIKDFAIFMLHPEECISRRNSAAEPRNGSPEDERSQSPPAARKRLLVSTALRNVTEHAALPLRSREQPREFALHLQSIREEERTRIAREIHDVLGQALTVLRIDLAWLGETLPPEQQPLRERVEGMKALIDATIQTVRRIATELRPGILDKLGPVAAIEWQAEEFEARTGIACTLANAWDELEFDKDLATAIFRIFQEILTNVARHAGATQVNIVLERQKPVLVLKVEDNGRGIREEEISDPTSLGLLGMRERILPWKGRIDLVGRPGQGTSVTVEVPFS